MDELSLQSVLGSSVSVVCGWPEGDCSLTALCVRIRFWCAWCMARGRPLTALVCASGAGAPGRGAGENKNPACKCGNASKVVQVKKEGPNKGRFFYACSGPREQQCKVGWDESV